jgi:hypothetical protein
LEAKFAELKAASNFITPPVSHEPVNVPICSHPPGSAQVADLVAPVGSEGIGDNLSHDATPELAAPSESAIDTANRNAIRRQLAETELLRDASRTNVEIAEKIGCSTELVRLVRKQLESEKRLQPIPVQRRDGSSYGVRESGLSIADDPAKREQT